MTAPATRAELQGLARLAQARVRKQTGALLVEGPRVLAEALAAGLVPTLVVVTERAAEDHRALLATAEAAGARLALADAEPLNRAADAAHGPGLLASVPAPGPAAPDVDGPPAGAPVLELALAGLQDPGNVGTLVRSARGFGAARVHLLPGTADPWGPKALRSSAGASLHVPLARVERAQELADRAAAQGFELLVAAAASDGQPDKQPAAELAPEHQLPARCLLVLGHETRGVPDLPGARAVSVPQRPELESLNVAMAGSILMAGWYARHGVAP